MKPNKLIGTLLCLFLICNLLGCSSHPKESEVIAPARHKSTQPTVGIEATQVAAEQNAEFVMEINFNKKEKELSKENKAKLHKFLGDASRKGELSQVKVISWADSEYPSVHTKRLSVEERKVANDRNNAIKSYIDEKKMNIDVGTYSMAERANALKEFVGTSEARVKKSLEIAGIPTTDTSVKFPSKASKSIIMIIMK